MRTILICFFSLVLPFGGLVSANSPAVTVNSLSPVQIGQHWYIGIHFHIKKDWHIYWQNSGESGMPTEFNLTVKSETVSIDTLFWPAPQLYAYDDLYDFGYSNRVLFPIQLKVQPKDSAGKIRFAFAADVSWLECNDVCIPGNATLSEKMVIDRENSASVPHREDIIEALNRLPVIVSGETIFIEKNTDTITINWTLQNAIISDGYVFIPLSSEPFDFSRGQAIKHSGKSISVSIRKSGYFTGTFQLAGVFTHASDKTKPSFWVQK
jgi:DsbC/DsbD-like thiol-disulfide interchange protein